MKLFDPFLLLSCGAVSLCCCHKNKCPTFSGSDLFTIIAQGSTSGAVFGTISIPFLVPQQLAINESFSDVIRDPILSTSIAPYSLNGVNGIRITFVLASYCKDVKYTFNYFGSATLNLSIAAAFIPKNYSVNWSSMNIPGAGTISTPTTVDLNGLVVLNSQEYSFINPANNLNGIVYLDILNTIDIEFTTLLPISLNLSQGQITVKFQT